MSQAPEPRVSGSQPSLGAESLQAASAEDSSSPAQAPGEPLLPKSGCSCEIEQRGLALAREGGRSRTECWSPTSRVSDVSSTMTWTVSPHSSGLTSRALLGCPAHCCPPSSADPAEDAGPREVRDLPRGTQHSARGEPASPRQPRRPGSQQLSFMSKEPAAPWRRGRKVGGCERGMVHAALCPGRGDGGRGDPGEAHRLGLRGAGG